MKEEGRKSKVKILPWSNIDCLCVMLSSPIWAGHICGELLFQPKADIFGSVCVCVCVCVRPLQLSL